MRRLCGASDLTKKTAVISSAIDDKIAVASDFLFGWLQFESISNFDRGFCLQGKGAICHSPVSHEIACFW